MSVCRQIPLVSTALLTLCVKPCFSVCFSSCQCASVKLYPPVFQTPAVEECPAESCREGAVRADHREGSVWDIPGQSQSSSCFVDCTDCKPLDISARALSPPQFYWEHLSLAACHIQEFSNYGAVGLLFSSWSTFLEQTPLPSLLSILHMLFQLWLISTVGEMVG